MENNETNLQKPGFWRLIGAYGIDILILWLFNFGYYMWWIHGSAPRISSQLWEMLIDGTFFVVLGAGYFALFEWKGNGSLGKKLFRLKLQMPRPSWWRVFVAYAIECVLFYALIWGIMLFSDTFTATWHVGEIGMVLPIIFGWFAGPVLICCYYAVLESIYGASWGKEICKLRVYKTSK